MRRRDFLTVLGAATTFPLPARAQPAANIPRIGFLGNSSAALEANLVGPFREGLHDLGYVQEQNIVIEYRWAEGNYERFPSLIAELLGQNVAVIVTAGTPASLAVKKATNSVPLAMVGVGDPVATGLVASLARPGGNVTGLTSTAEETEGKRWELLKELIPKLSHVAALWNPDNPTLLSQLKEMWTAAQVLGIRVLVLSVRNPREIEESLKAIVGEQPGALIVMGDRLFLHNRHHRLRYQTGPPRGACT